MKSQLSLDPPGQHHFIRAVSEAGIRIDDALYTGPLLVTADVIDPWTPQSLDTLDTSDLDALLALEPQLVLLGTGARQAFLPPARLAPLYRAGIGIELMTTDAACRTFNVLASEGRNVVAALLPIEA